MTVKEKKVCARCSLNRNIADYYTTRLISGEEHDGRVDVCKTCIGNNFKVSDPGTFMHVLAAVDHPWLPIEFKAIAETYSTSINPNNISILGRYISKMKLAQYNKYGFMDSDTLQAELGDESTQDPIENYAYKTPLVKPVSSTAQNDSTMTIDIYNGQTASELLESSKDKPIDNKYNLTNDEIAYLTFKWGSFYNIEELVTLERKYAEMAASYEIETAMHRDYLKKLCTISMQYDNAVATIDIDAAAKISNMYSRITKEAGFQPSQNDSTSNDYMDAVGHIVKMVEEHGPIPVYDIDEDPDLVDITIKDLKMFNLNLVKNDDSIMERNNIAMQELREQDEMVARTVEEDEELDYSDPIYAIDMDDYDEVELIDDRHRQRSN